MPLCLGLPVRRLGDSPFDHRRQKATVAWRAVQGLGSQEQAGLRGQGRQLYGLRSMRPGVPSAKRHQVEASDLGLNGLSVRAASSWTPWR